MTDVAERQTYTCTRCNGTGRYSFNLQHGTMCFGCRGTGRQKTRTKAPTPKWAVFGQHRETGEWLRLYNVVAATEGKAIGCAQNIYSQASTAWKNTYTLATARALKWTDMASVDALSWNEALKPETKEKA
jgi:1,2-phenylacetyl-CoA epoxidase PaaB subunit